MGCGTQEREESQLIAVFKRGDQEQDRSRI